MNTRKWLSMVVLAMGALVMSSCLDTKDDGMERIFPNALVTVKQAADGKSFLQLDENTTLFPENINTSFCEGKEMRALVNYGELDQTTPGYNKTVHIYWIDTIRTKDVVLVNPGDLLEFYGSDPVDIVRDWVTVAEDGYLTLRVRTFWSGTGKKHYLNLIGGKNPENPYEVELRHNADGDPKVNQGDALIAFRLTELIKDWPADQELTLKWYAMDGTIKRTTFALHAMSATTFQGDLKEYERIENFQ